MSAVVINAAKILDFLKNITPTTMQNDLLPLDSAHRTFKIGGSKHISNSNNKTFNEIKTQYHKAYGI